MQNSDWQSTRLDGGCFFVVVGGAVVRCVVVRGARHLLPFLCLAPFTLFVPGTFSSFCAWHLSPFLYLAPFPLFVPGTKTPFGARYKNPSSPSSHQTQKSSQPSGLAAFCIKHLISYSSVPLRT
ncbi:hypothetical protein Q0M98_18405 [Rossellomorea marisflavi]